MAKLESTSEEHLINYEEVNIGNGNCTFSLTMQDVMVFIDMVLLFEMLAGESAKASETRFADNGNSLW